MPNRAIADFPVFAGFIQDRAKDFTGREWVFAEIDRWLADPEGPAFFIITGEPGVGKSAIAARLTQMRDLAAYHFCIARQADTINPALFARSLSHQLCRIDGFALGILKDSNLDLKTTQNVQANYGQIIGTKIENLTVNAPSGADAFTHAVTQPLKTLYRDGYDQQVVILVDALDEAVQHKGSETIVDLLANAGDLPRQVRFVLTSRPEGAALRHFEERPIPHFRLDAGRPENLEDIRRYVRGQLATSTALRGRVADQHMAEATFVERITTASQGNFLYVVWLLPAIAAGTQRFDALEALPQGLDGIYREFLRTRKTADEVQWQRVYEPILGVLVVAQAPLTRELIAQFTGITIRDVRFGLQDLRQFLDPASADEGRYSLYHQSINDWLQNEARSEEFCVDVTPIHQRIVRYYRKDATSWGEIHWERAEEVDEYGFSHVTGHLFALRTNPVYCRQLYEFVCRPVMVAKRQRTGADRAFAADVEPVLKAAAEQELRNWVQMGRASLLYAMLGSLATNVAPAMLGALAACGQVERALAYAELVQDSQQRFESYLRIGTAVLAQAGQPEWASAIFEQALRAAEAIQDAGARSYAFSQVAQALVALAQAGQPEQVLRVAEAIQDDGVRSQALSEVAQALAQAGPSERVTSILEQALHTVETIQNVRCRIQEDLSQMVQVLAQAGQSGRAVAIMKQTLHVVETIQHAVYRLQDLSQVAQALAQAGQSGQAVAIMEQTLRAVETIQHAVYRSQALSEVAQAPAQTGPSERVTASLEQVLRAAEAIQDAVYRLQDLSQMAQALAQASPSERAASIVKQVLRAAEAIQDAVDRLQDLSQMAQALAQAGQLERAAAIMEQTLRVVGTIQDAVDRLQDLSQVVQALAQAVQPEGVAAILEQALQTVETIHPGWYRIQEDLSQVAQVLAQAGQSGRAVAIMKQTLRVVETIPDVVDRMQDAVDRLQAFSQVTQALGAIAQAGQFERTAAIIEQVLRAVETIQGGRYRMQAFSQVAQALAQADQPERAAAIFEQALRAAQLSRSQQEQAEAFRQMADGLIQLVQTGFAHLSLAIIEQYLNSIENLKQTQAGNHAYTAIAKTLAKANRCEWIDSIGEGADNLYVQLIVQTSAANCLRQTGQTAPALSLATKAAATVRATKGKQDRVTALTQASQLLGQFSQQQQARELLDLAIATAGQIKPSHQHAIAASQIARALAALAQPDEADRFATTARDAARSVKKLATAIDCLAQAAIALYAVGRRGDGLNEIEHALGLAERLTEIDQAHAWSELARSLVALGEIPRATALVKDAWSKLASNGSQPNTAIVQAHVAQSLDLVGLRDEALAAFQSALLQARYAGRDSVLEVLAEGVPVLAALDNGDTVWQLYQVIQEIDGWWQAP